MCERGEREARESRPGSVSFPPPPTLPRTADNRGDIALHSSRVVALIVVSGLFFESIYISRGRSGGYRELLQPVPFFPSQPPHMARVAAWEVFFATLMSLIATLQAFSPSGFLLPARNFRGLMSLTATPIKVTQPTPADVDKMQIKSWSTWGCGESRFPWSYGDTETAYLTKGIVTVTPDDATLPAVTLKRGDLAVFPAGMSCTWDVKEAISKHYKFD